jgi:type II secretory pathway predicted ATPase ExeA
MGYLSYWSLRRKPFLDSERFFAGVPQRAAIAGLSEFVGEAMDVAFLVAPAGCGTSRLLRHAALMRGFGDCAAEVIVMDAATIPGCNVSDALCQSLGYSGDGGVVAQRISLALRASAQHGVRTVCMIDRCEPATALQARELLAQQRGLSVVMAIQPREHGRCAAAVGRCGVRIDLTPLELSDSIDYLRDGIEHAGGGPRLFPDNAAVRLHELSGGVLAELAVLAESSLAVAARHRLDEVLPAAVEAASEQVARAA